METGTYSPIQEESRNEQIGVTTTSSVVCFARQGLKRRQNLLIRNTSTNAADIITVNMGFGAAVANKGIVLRQNESFSDCNNANYECWQGSITAICATANGLLSIFER